MDMRGCFTIWFSNNPCARQQARISVDTQREFWVQPVLEEFRSLSWDESGSWKNTAVPIKHRGGWLGPCYSSRPHNLHRGGAAHSSHPDPSGQEALFFPLPWPQSLTSKCREQYEVLMGGPVAGAEDEYWIGSLGELESDPGSVALRHFSVIVPSTISQASAKPSGRAVLLSKQ